MFQSQFAPSEVVQWSNHRVMEWLRSVDLAEYAPNLRGSGVHGGLVVSASNYAVHETEKENATENIKCVSPLVDAGTSV